MSADDDGGIAVIDVRASYLNLGDSGLLLPLLPESQRRQLEALAPTGELRDLVAQVSDLQADEPFFDVTVRACAVSVARSAVTGRVGASKRARAIC